MASARAAWSCRSGPKANHAALDVGRAPASLTHHAGKTSMADVAAVGGPDQLKRCLPMRRGCSGRGRGGFVENARLVEPAHDVAPAVSAWQPRVATDRQRDRPTGPVQFFSELDTRRGSTDDQHAAFGEIAWRLVG